MTWILDIFVIVSILLLVGMLAVGFHLTTKDGRKFGKSGSSSKSNPFQMK